MIPPMFLPVPHTKRQTVTPLLKIFRGDYRSIIFIVRTLRTGPLRHKFIVHIKPDSLPLPIEIKRCRMDGDIQIADRLNGEPDIRLQVFYPAIAKPLAPTVKAPLSVAAATALAISIVPLANGSFSKIPIGPFQNTVLADSISF